MKSAYNYIISACLCGQACRYDGGAFPVPALVLLAEQGKALALCPEVLGGLPVPRPPCEIRGGRVLDGLGQDRTEAFMRGAALTLDLAREHGIRTAVLKERSPSCGSRLVYDGSFSGRIRPGRGLTAALLVKEGLAVLNEDEWLILSATALGRPR